MKKNNPNQEKAILHKDGPCLVISGPGSGKTYVITNRIYNLIKNYKIKAKSILVITFTRASADEMKARFLKLAKEKRLILDSEPVFGTFHSVFYEILRRDFGYSSNSLIEKEESLAILNSIREYEKILYEYRKIDFSDMIVKCHELLEDNSLVLEKYQNLFRYILIDEFQDINKSQYNLVKLICKSENLFVVGDDDQSIYSFRGSMPSVMKDFLKDYPDATKICLDINYRSKSNIVNYSKRLIDYNKMRFKKSLTSNDKEIGVIEIKKFTDSRDEDHYIIEKIREYMLDGYNMRDIAILYRTNLLSHSVMQDLEKSGIRYRIKTDENDIGGEDAVNLMTFHLSKGLEFKTVFIIDANDGITPHKKSIKDYELETERRLFYVAMTRAKSNLHIYFTSRRFGKNYMASRFILEVLGGIHE